jgi:putative ABC transport system substrate-binding protein
MKNSGATTVIVQPGPFTFLHRDHIITSATSHGLATIFAFSSAAREGALIGYGIDSTQVYRIAPFYVDRILKGAKPADLPVQQPTRYSLQINLRAAKTLGVELPLALLIRADELIE